MPRLALPTRPLDECPDVMTADEAAPYMRTSGRNLRRLIADGSLDSITVRIGARRFVSRHLLRRYIDGELEVTE